MTGPMDTVLAFHNAFRRDIETIDAAALGLARGEAGHEAALERCRFLNEMLVWHAHGEELATFPALEAVAPLVAEAYLRDHRGLDDAYEALNDAVSAGDTLQAARPGTGLSPSWALHGGTASPFRTKGEPQVALVPPVQLCYPPSGTVRERLAGSVTMQGGLP